MVFYQYPDERQVLETWLRDPARNGGADAFGAFLDKWVERDDEIHDTEGLCQFTSSMRRSESFASTSSATQLLQRMTFTR